MKKTKRKYRSDLLPFAHGEEGTHFACAKRLEKEGCKTRCCGCVPHEDCESMQKHSKTMQNKTWELQFEEQFKADENGYLQLDYKDEIQRLKDFIASQIEKTRREAVVDQVKLANKTFQDGKKAGLQKAWVEAEKANMPFATLKGQEQFVRKMKKELGID